MTIESYYKPGLGRGFLIWTGDGLLLFSGTLRGVKGLDGLGAGTDTGEAVSSGFGKGLVAKGFTAVLQNDFSVKVIGSTNLHSLYCSNILAAVYSIPKCKANLLLLLFHPDCWGNYVHSG